MAVTGTSPRLPSASTSSPARARVRARSPRARASPAEPRRSKQASCGLTATQAGPAASISARQWASTAAAASAAAGAGLRRRRRRRPCRRARWRGARALAGGLAGSGHRRAGSGSIPRTICDSRAATAAASRSPNGRGAGASPDQPAPGIGGAAGYLTAFLRPEPAVKRGTRLAAIVIVSPVRGLRPSRAPRSATWNLPKPVKLTSSPPLSDVLDRADDRVDGVVGVLLGQTARLTRPCRRIPTSSWLLLCRRGGQFPARDRGFGEANSAFGRLRGLSSSIPANCGFFRLSQTSEPRWAAEISRRPHLGAAPRGGRRAPACAARRARRTTTRGSRRARRRAKEALTAPTGRACAGASRDVPALAGEVGEHDPEVEAHERGEREAAAHEHDRVAVASGPRRRCARRSRPRARRRRARRPAARAPARPGGRARRAGSRRATARRPPRCRPTACAGTPGTGRA